MSETGQKRKSWPSSGTSALPPITDMQRPLRYVRFVPFPDSCAAAWRSYSIASSARASNGRLMFGSTAAGRRDNGLRAVRLGVPKRIRKGEPQGGVHRLRGLNSSSNCDSFGTVSKCGASDGIVSQDALDPVYRCAPVSRVSKSSSKPAGTQK
jgi:hypothetical protein